MENLGAIAASSITFIPPVVTLMIGALLMGEPIQAIDYLATLCIIFGVIILKHK